MKGDISNTEKNKKVENKYFERARSSLQSKLSRRNLIKPISSWAVAGIRYESGIIN